MPDEPDDICPRPNLVPPGAARSLATPLFPSTVYHCESPEEASAMLGGEQPGFVYSRDGHPNAAQLAAKCAELHGAEQAAVVGSGMAALALAMLSQLRSGDHVVVSDSLYGRSLKLFTSEAPKLGVASTTVNVCDLPATRAAMQSNTRMIVVETISNPTLRVPDIRALSQLAHEHGARLLVDNSFASPVVCRPLDFGADLVVESITKIINGHSDVLLGLICGTEAACEPIAELKTTWGFFASPWDCWLALRGLATLHLRAERASANAARVAEMLAGRKDVKNVAYPGLASHPDHMAARRQFRGQFGNMVSFTLLRGEAAAGRMIEAAAGTIPFCPSLGELSTTLSHPESTSHRTISAEARAALGIEGGTIRLSVGTESAEQILTALSAAIDASGQR